MRTESRVTRVLAAMLPAGLDALLVTNPPNVRFLLDQPQLSGGAFLVSYDRQTAVVDRRRTLPETPPADLGGREPADLSSIMQVLADVEGRIGYDDLHLSIKELASLEERVPEGTQLVPAGGIVESVRELKCPAEVRRVAEAAKLTDAVLAFIAESRWLGRTERDIAMAVERRMLELGADAPAFPTIVAAPPRSAVVHIGPTDNEIRDGDLVIVDLGAALDGYASDCTRMFCVGEPTEEQQRIYDILLDAQRRAIGAIKAGAQASHVDALARTPIVDAGLGPYFGHGLGHGVGVEIHEGPRLAPKVTTQLHDGHIVTVEPGVYMPNRFGLRIEDLVAVTPSGCTVLSGFPKDRPIVVA